MDPGRKRKGSQGTGTLERRGPRKERAVGVAAQDPVPDPPGASASGHKGGAVSLPHPPGGVGHKRQVLRVAEKKRGLVTLTLMRSGPQGGEESRKVTWATPGETPQLVIQSWQI